MKLTQQVLLPISISVWALAYNLFREKLEVLSDLQKITFFDNIPFPKIVFTKRNIYSWAELPLNKNFHIQFELIENPDTFESVYNYSPIYRNNPRLKKNLKKIIIIFNKEKEWCYYKKAYDYPIIRTCFPTIFIFDSNIGTFIYSNEITERPLNSITEVNKYSNSELVSLAY